MRAFIFSLDAFVAFTLALIAIYSLIFFSSVPSAYYFLLTQGHYLSRDILLSLSTTQCDRAVYDCQADGSMLENIVSDKFGPYDAPSRKNLIQDTIGKMVPKQFGYIVEMSTDQGVSWVQAYNTAGEASDSHSKKSKKLAVATQVITFDYGGKILKLQTSPYNYLTCRGDGVMGGGGTGPGGANETVDFGLITCGETSFQSDGQSVTQNIGNTPPSTILRGDLVPSSDVKLVKLTIFI